MVILSTFPYSKQYIHVYRYMCVCYMKIFAYNTGSLYIKINVILLKLYLGKLKCH